MARRKAVRVASEYMVDYVTRDVDRNVVEMGIKCEDVLVVDVREG